MPSVARIQWAKFRVTLVSLTAIVILCVLLYELFGGLILAPKTTAYLFIPDASGLTGESPVRVDGIDVGRVSGVQLSGASDANRTVKVTILLYRDRISGIPADSVTQISSDTLIGDKFVDITSGTSPTNVGPGGELIYKFQPELLKSLDLTEFTRQLRQVDAMLADIESGRSAFGQFYHGTRFYDDLLHRLNELQRGFQAAVATDTMVGGLLSSDQLYRQVSDQLVAIDNSIAQIQSGQGAAGRLLRDSAQYDQLVSQAQGLRKSIDAVAQYDIFKSDATWVNANQALTGLIQNVDEFNRNPAIETTATYENLNQSFKQLGEMLKDIRLNPRKYLRLKVF